MKPHAMDIKNISHTYNKNTVALDNITTSFKQGVTGLIGRNGAGKTTLLALMASFFKPQTGSISFQGQTVYENADAMAAINFVFPRDFSEDDHSIESYFNDISRLRPNFDLAYAKTLAKRFELPLHKHMSALSTGMASIVNVIEGIAANTPVTLFDEIHVNMDAVSRDIFYDVLNEAKASDRIFIVSTHLVSEMAHLFDDVVMLNQGKLMLEGACDTLLSKAFILRGEQKTLSDNHKHMRVLETKQLGKTVALKVIIEDLSVLQTLKNKAIDIEPLSLQALFIALTKEAASHA